MINKIKNKRAEGYIDVCVAVIAFAMVVALMLNIISFITLKISLDRDAEYLMEYAAFYGAFDEGFIEEKEKIQGKYNNCTITFSADEYFSTPLRRVQLGEKMNICIKAYFNLGFGGDIGIPVKAEVNKTGLSEKYWK